MSVNVQMEAEATLLGGTDEFVRFESTLGNHEIRREWWEQVGSPEKIGITLKIPVEAPRTQDEEETNDNAPVSLNYALNGEHLSQGFENVGDALDFLIGAQAGGEAFGIRLVVDGHEYGRDDIDQLVAEREKA